MSLPQADDRAGLVRGLICRSPNRHNPTVAASLAATHLRCRPQSRPPRLDGYSVSGIKDPINMICEPGTKQQFLVTWYHPVEANLTWDDDSWVVSRNDDFGYEVARALVIGESEYAVKEAIRKRYNNPAVNLVFRSCTQHPMLETFLQMARKPGWGSQSGSFGLHLLTA